MTDIMLFALDRGVDLQGKVIRVLHLNLTRVREPDYGLWLGWFPAFGLLKPLPQLLGPSVMES